MHIVIRQLRHRFHDDRKLLHPRNILNHVQLGPSNRHVPEEMQKQIITRSHTMNVSDRRVLRARIGCHHHVTFLFRLHKLLGDVALNNFVSEIPTHRIATKRINLKALLQRQPAGFKTDVHQASAGEVGVSENSFRPQSLRILPRLSESRK